MSTGSSSEPTEVDQIYQVLKQATEISNSRPRVNVELVPGDRTIGGSPQGAPATQARKPGAANLAVINPAPCSTTSAPPAAYQGGSRLSSASSDLSMRRRLFAGMKSLTGFGSRSRQRSPGHRSISLPESTLTLTKLCFPSISAKI
nr:unnamed protein product [Callosobruchus analis]